MNLKNRMILEDYRKSRDAFVKLGDIVHDMLSSMAAESGVQVVAIEHRVKSEESLAGKLARSVDYYQAFEDNKCKFYAVATNCRTGEPEYFHIKNFKTQN